MHRRLLAIVTALTISVFILSAQALAQSSVKIGIAAGYAKGNNAFDVVVKDKPGTKLVMYVNDKSPSKATANKKDWATFHRVKLVGSGKISFAKVVKGSNHKSYKKPINYTRQYTVSNGKVRFSSAHAHTSTTATPAPAPTPTPAPAPAPTCTNGTYINSAGNTVCSPASSPSVPQGATAQCVDGIYSFSQSRRGTCSHHGGVARWL